MPVASVVSNTNFDVRVLCVCVCLFVSHEHVSINEFSATSPSPFGVCDGPYALEPIVSKLVIIPKKQVCVHFGSFSAIADDRSPFNIIKRVFFIENPFLVNMPLS